MKKAVYSLIMLLLSLSVAAQTVNFGKKSRIVLEQRSESALQGAQILGRYLGEATGFAFPLAKEGAKAHKGDIILADRPGLPEDSFRISLKGGAILLEGEGKALVYAACDFLEQEMGMDYWGNGEYNLPSKTAVQLRQRTEIPCFRYRQTSHWSLRNGKVATSDNGVNKIRQADTLYRLWYRLEEPHDLFVDNLWVHTCDKLLPASRYGAAHPEYYAFFGGERHPGSASQWCFSNPEVFDIVCERLDSLFKANPQQQMISISQNDGSDTYCRCPECAALIQKEQSPSGPILHFLNKVARRFPDKQISTLAYLFSVVPPRYEKPEPNVSIMLCDIDCRRQTSLPENPSGQEFMACLKGWSAICDNIFLWDYGINFDNYLSPFPNLQTIKDNMVIFRDHGVKMHFSQINSTLGGDMSDLRPYLVSKLMWNPGASLDSLERHFCEAYYGAAAPQMLRYIHTLEGACVGSDVDLFIYDSPVSYKNTMLRPSLMRRYNSIFDQAEAAVAADPKRLERVRMARLPLQYSALEIARTNPDRDAAAVESELKEFEKAIRHFGIETLNERGNSPLDYCAMYRDRYLKDAKDNLAYGKTVLYLTGPKASYAQLGRTALTDGLYGGMGYVENWVGWEGTDADFIVDLESENTVRSVSVDFLRQIGGWVLEPRGVVFSVSCDGENFTPFDSVQIPENRDGSIGFLLAEGRGEARARFVRVQVEGVKICPEWHYGVGNPCWFFIDEVCVK